VAPKLAQKGFSSMTDCLKRRSRLFSILPILVIVAMALSFSALSGAPPPDPPAPTELTLEASDDGRRVQLHEAEVLVISLESNPSTGYGWELDQAQLSIESLPVLRQTGSEYQARQVLDSSAAEPAQPLLGAPMTQVLRFEAVRAGETSLNLVYRRPWEDVPPLDSFSLEVEAVGSYGDAAPTITETDESSNLPAAPAPADLGDEGSLGLPEAFNWCDQGACTSVKNQSSCGSCWAFATVGILESNILIHDSLSRNLSEQYLLSCNTDGYNCTRGGDFAHDYHEWKYVSGEPDAGAVYETDFPYTARDDPCNPPHTHYEKIDDWDYVGNAWSVPPVADIKQAILDHGPVAVAMCIGDAFRNYHGGNVFETDECGSLNHAVILVGWDDNQGANGVWYLRNSWGAGWGESGYMRIGYGVSSVGYRANYVVYYPACYDLDTVVTPVGAGTVVADPLPNCEGGGYEPDTIVELTANANPGWQFFAWFGDASGSDNPIDVTMDSDKSIRAQFLCDECGVEAHVPLAMNGTSGAPPGWNTILNEGFEGSFPGPWELVDNQSGYGQYYWGKRNCRAFEGSYSGWAVGGGADGSSLACGSDYPDHAESWMSYGPFSLQGATAADLQFKLWLDSESRHDYVYWVASMDGADYYGQAVCGYTGGWADIVMDLADVYEIGSLLGEPEVWIAFVFQTNEDTHYPEGVYVDNVVLRKYLSATGEPAPPTTTSCTTCGTQLTAEPAALTRQR
jgi:C1A family cysteine protease/predicted secreted protein